MCNFTFKKFNSKNHTDAHTSAASRCANNNLTLTDAALAASFSFCILANNVILSAVISIIAIIRIMNVAKQNVCSKP